MRMMQIFGGKQAQKLRMREKMPPGEQGQLRIPSSG